MLQDLTPEFPDSDWISATAALAQYNLRNFDEAQELYEDLLERDPHRIDVSAGTPPLIRRQVLELYSGRQIEMGRPFLAADPKGLYV